MGSGEWGDEGDEGDGGDKENNQCPMPHAQCPNFKSESLPDIAAAMPTAGYAYAVNIAKLTKEIKIKIS
ncbi:MAG: hypothetical protein V7K27_14520 [Nostoc sp.]|uniref:hypothetical protein n=1 Tax=Nostoc sp. TaxID=1180 RepID=UPI002FF4DD7B